MDKSEEEEVIELEYRKKDPRNEKSKPRIKKIPIKEQIPDVFPNSRKNKFKNLHTSSNNFLVWDEKEPINKTPKKFVNFEENYESFFLTNIFD